MNKVIFIILTSLMFFFAKSLATNPLTTFNKKPLVKIYKSGPYLGLQRGKYTNLELGYEFQRKAVKLIKPITHSINTGFDYNLTENVLDFSAGYWQKRGRLNLTYGGNFVFKTDFEHNKFGIAPTVGYKASILHLQTGINLTTRNENFKNTNLFFVSLRVVLINNRKFNWRKRKKN